MLNYIINNCRECTAAIRPMSRAINYAHVYTCAHTNKDIFGVIMITCTELAIEEIFAAYEKYIYDELSAAIKNEIQLSVDKILIDPHIVNRVLRPNIQKIGDTYRFWLIIQNNELMVHINNETIFFKEEWIPIILNYIARTRPILNKNDIMFKIIWVNLPT